MLRWVPKGHRVINPADPDLRTIADVGFALGLRFVPRTVNVRYEWRGPWRLHGDVWRREYGPDRRVHEVPLPMWARVEVMQERLMMTIMWIVRAETARSS